MSEKRGAASMEAAAMSFVLDREGHKKHLRVATNQELEMQNKQLEIQNEALRQQLADKVDESGHWYTAAHSYEDKWNRACQELTHRMKNSGVILEKFTNNWQKHVRKRLLWRSVLGKRFPGICLKMRMRRKMKKRRAAAPKSQSSLQRRSLTAPPARR